MLATRKDFGAATGGLDEDVRFAGRFRHQPFPLQVAMAP
jgi:hypothetical protein